MDTKNSREVMEDFLRYANPVDDLLSNYESGTGDYIAQFKKYDPGKADTISVDIGMPEFVDWEPPVFNSEYSFDQPIFNYEGVGVTGWVSVDHKEYEPLDPPDTFEVAQDSLNIAGTFSSALKNFAEVASIGESVGEDSGPLEQTFKELWALPEDLSLRQFIPKVDQEREHPEYSWKRARTRDCFLHKKWARGASVRLGDIDLQEKNKLVDKSRVVMLARTIAMAAVHDIPQGREFVIKHKARFKLRFLPVVGANRHLDVSHGRFLPDKAVKVKMVDKKFGEHLKRWLLQHVAPVRKAKHVEVTEFDQAVQEIVLESISQYTAMPDDILKVKHFDDANFEVFLRPKKKEVVRTLKQREVYQSVIIQNLVESKTHSSDIITFVNLYWKEDYDKFIHLAGNIFPIQTLIDVFNTYKLVHRDPIQAIKLMLKGMLSHWPSHILPESQSPKSVLTQVLQIESFKSQLADVSSAAYVRYIQNRDKINIWDLDGYKVLRSYSALAKVMGNYFNRIKDYWQIHYRARAEELRENVTWNLIRAQFLEKNISCVQIQIRQPADFVVDIDKALYVKNIRATVEHIYNKRRLKPPDFTDEDVDVIEWADYNVKRKVKFSFYRLNNELLKIVGYWKQDVNDAFILYLNSLSKLRNVDFDTETLRKGENTDDEIDEEVMEEEFEEEPVDEMQQIEDKVTIHYDVEEAELFDDPGEDTMEGVMSVLWDDDEYYGVPGQVGTVAALMEDNVPLQLIQAYYKSLDMHVPETISVDMYPIVLQRMREFRMDDRKDVVRDAFE